jgi:hypothetical protein
MAAFVLSSLSPYLAHPSRASDGGINDGYRKKKPAAGW